MSSEKLFLLEIAVTELKITADLNNQINDSNLDQSTCISFQFLQLQPLEICEQKSLSDSKTCFKNGKSCMFSLPVSNISKLADQDFNLQVRVFKQLANDTKIIPSTVPIGEVNIDLADLVLSIARSVFEAPDEVPVTKSLNRNVTFKNVSGKESAEVTVFLRLSCHGDQLISRFELECGKSFVVKSPTAETAYRCNEISLKNGNNLEPQTVTRGCDCKFIMPQPNMPFKSCQCKFERPPLFQGATTSYPFGMQMPSVTTPDIPSQRPRNLCACDVRQDLKNKFHATNISAAGDRKLTKYDRSFDIEEYLKLKKMPVDSGGTAQAKEKEGAPTTTGNIITSPPNEKVAEVDGISSQPAMTSADNQIVPTSHPQPSAPPHVEIGLDNTERGNSMALYSLNPSYNVNFNPDRTGVTAVRISPKTGVFPEASRSDDRYLVRLASFGKTTGKQNSILLDLRTPRPPQPPATVSRGTQYSLEDIQPTGAAVVAAKNGSAAPAQGKKAKGGKGKGGKKK